MSRAHSFRGLSVALMAGALFWFVAGQQSALSGICLREAFNPVHTGCDLGGEDSDAHLDPLQRHMMPALFVHSERLAVLAASTAVMPFMPRLAEWPNAPERTGFRSEPLVESLAPRAPPTGRSRA